MVDWGTAGDTPTDEGARLHGLHTDTRLKMGSNKVFMVVRNMSESTIFLKKKKKYAPVSPCGATQWYW